MVLRLSVRAIPGGNACWPVAMLVAVLAVGGAAGQEAQRSQGATLPASNEALLLANRIEQALHVGDERLAIRLMDELAAIEDGLVANRASRVYYPVWRQVFRLARQFPASAVDLYRQLHDAEVAALLDDARGRGNLSVLRSLFRRYPLSTAWPRIGGELAARLLDAGRFGEAVEVLRDMLRADVPDHELVQAELVVALGGAGAVRSARGLLGRLEARRSDQGGSGKQRLRLLAQWLGTLETRARGDGHAFASSLRRGALWQATLRPESAGGVSVDEEDIVRVLDVLRQLPAYAAVVDGRTLAVRAGGRLVVIDADTLVPRWHVDPPRYETAAPPGGGMRLFGELEPQRPAVVDWSPETAALFSDHLRQAVSVAGNLVLTVEGGIGEARAIVPPMFRGSGFQRAACRNELVARDKHDGRIVWRTSVPPANPLYDAAFQDVPLLARGRLIAPVLRGDRLNLVLIDPADGRLIRELPLVGPPVYFPAGGGRCSLIADDATLYVSTGNGVVAALTVEELRWKWATVYPSTAGLNRTRFWWQPAPRAETVSAEPPVLAGDLLVVAPADTHDVIAIDRFSGEQRWRVRRDRYPYLVGAVPDGVVLAGDEVVCLDLVAPSVHRPLWRSVPLVVTGRGVTCGPRVFVPTAGGIVEIDGRSGKIVADQSGPPSAASVAAGDRPAALPASSAPLVANLTAARNALFAVAPRRIVKYPDPAATRASCRSASTEPDDPARAALVRAWLDVFEDHDQRALDRLGGLKAVDERFAEACDRLREVALVGRARKLPPGPQRLALLCRARDLAKDPDLRVALSLRVGRTLEQMEQWRAALKQYGEMIAAADGTVAASGQEGLTVAGWVAASERAGAVSTHVDRAALEQLVVRLAEDRFNSETGGSDAGGLRRLHAVLRGDPLQPLVGLHLVCRKIPPEQKLRYLPEADKAWPVSVRRRLLLERWDTHVSLGMLDAARADREAWAALAEVVGGSEPAAPQPAWPAPLSESALRRRVAAVRLAQRKLEQDRGRPFSATLGRQWKAPSSELLLDPRRPLAATSLWTLAENLAQRKITLINTFKHQQPQRQTEDRLVGAAQRLMAADAALRGGGGERDAWPMTRYGPLAAVPVPGGIVCVGMGPERYAGRRQWELAVPQWRDIPTDYDDRVVAGPAGLCIVPRRDRVVLVDWADGGLHWRRDLPGLAVRRIECVGENLLLIGQDQRVWTLDARSGRNLRRVNTGSATPRRVDVVGDTVVVWGADSVAGIDGQTLSPVWKRPCATVVDAAAAANRPWLAYRTRDSDQWYMLDVRTGAPVGAKSLGTFSAITAIWADGKRVFVGGRVGWRDEENREVTARLVALRADGGQTIWTHDFCSTVTINATQLAAHPRFVPVLLAGVEVEQPGEIDLPAIQLVDKATGRLHDPVSISGDFQRVPEATCETTLIATPARVIVQIGGNLIAYGDSPLDRMP